MPGFAVAASSGSPKEPFQISLVWLFATAFQQPIQGLVDDDASDSDQQADQCVHGCPSVAGLGAAPREHQSAERWTFLNSYSGRADITGSPAKSIHSRLQVPLFAVSERTLLAPRHFHDPLPDTGRQEVPSRD